MQTKSVQLPTNRHLPSLLSNQKSKVERNSTFALESQGESKKRIALNFEEKQSLLNIRRLG